MRHTIQILAAIAGAVASAQQDPKPQIVGPPQSVEVRAAISEALPEAGVVSENSLTALWLRNLAGVLTADPLRAAQSLPGVVANDDFQSRFSLRGALPEQIGTYIDGVPVRSVLHRTEEGPAQASLAILPNDLVETITVYSGSPPPSLSDRSAGAVNLLTREGNREQAVRRFDLGMTSASGSAEGPISVGRGFWMAGFRRSYIQYLLNWVDSDPGQTFRFQDGYGKLSYDVAPTQRLTLFSLVGWSGLDPGPARRDAMTEAVESNYRVSLVSLAWQCTSLATMVLTNRVSLSEGVGKNRSTAGAEFDDSYRDWSWIGSGSWAGHSRSVTDFGWSIGRNADRPPAPGPIWRQADWQASGHASNTMKFLRGGIVVNAGVRWAGTSRAGVVPASARAALRYGIRPGLALHAAWGRYGQPGERSARVQEVPPVTSSHWAAGIEKGVGRRGRLLVEAYQRVDRNLSYEAGNDRWNAPYSNSRGLEATYSFQARRMLGSVSYALAASRMRLDTRMEMLPSAADQRHTVHAQVHCTLKRQTAIIVKWNYGSGLPVPGLANPVQRVRDYQRLDVRVNRSKEFRRARLTLYAEFLNVPNRRNVRFEGFEGNSTNHAASFGRMLPFLPAAGLSLQF